MTLEKTQARRLEVDAAITQRQKEISDLQSQVTQAEATIRQWTDLLLIQRGQLIELDNQIAELTVPLDETPTEEKKKKK